MKIVVFGPERRVGALEGERIVDLNRVDSRLPSRLDVFIEAGHTALEGARRALERAERDAVIEAKSVKLHAPWPGRRIAMVGGNYADHLAGMNANLHGSTSPDSTIEGATRKARESAQWGFWKVPAAVSGPEDEVPFPKRAKYLDYEGEAAVVLGKRGKDISAARIDEYVWGVTLVNDWSIRDGGGTPRAMSYNLNKNFDGSTSIGPCILVGELGCQNVEVETKVNGELRQRFNSKNMIFSFGEVLEFLSRDFTFVPGDIISGGTAAGTAADRTKPLPDGTRPLHLFLKVGDILEISSPKIGALRNRLVRG